MPAPHTESVNTALGRLSPLEEAQLALAGAMVRAYGSALYALDILAIAAINRSMAHCAGFRGMINARNFICAGSLLRLQLDTALRFSAAWLVSDPHALAHEVLKGTPIRNLKDRDGHPLTDAHLVAVLARDDPWITNVYKETSGYIHLSEKHIFNALTDVDGERRIGFKMHSEDAVVADELYVEVIDAFADATRVFLKYLEGWVVTKSNPEAVAALRRAPESSTDARDA